jgi:hypothetical protein
MDDRALALLRQVAQQAINEQKRVLIGGDPLITLLDSYREQQARIATLEKDEAISAAARAYVTAEHEISADIESVRRTSHLWEMLVIRVMNADAAVAKIVMARRAERRQQDMDERSE